jgi:hypothetical protein
MSDLQQKASLKLSEWIASSDSADRDETVNLLPRVGLLSSGLLTWTTEGEGSNPTILLFWLIVALPYLLTLAALVATISFFAVVFVQSFVKNPFTDSSRIN